MFRPSQPAPAAGDGEQAGEQARYLERAQRLVPRIAAAAEETERERRIPEPVMEGLHEAELFRLFLPRSLGGGEAHPLTFMQVVETLAGADASTAWNVGQNAVCGLAAASMAPEAAREVFGDPRAIVAWGPPDPGSRAVACDGGYRVSGRWSFASGGRHATWLGAYCPVHEADGSPRRGPGGGTVRRVMLLPAGQVAMEDVWHVIGLRGTASDAFSLDDRFVADAFSVMRDDTSEVREPGWLYRFKTTNLFSCGFASIALGVARTMLEAFVRLAAEKTPRGFSNPLRENAATQAELARAEARLGAARAYLFHTAAGVCDEVQRTMELTMPQRMAIRLAATHAIREAMEVGTFAYGTAGSTAIFSGSPFERRFRDLHAIGQQVQGRKSHYETVGRFLLGLEADGPFV